MIITYKEIANRAFQIWKNEGEPEGNEQEHWLKAEIELRKVSMKEQKGKTVSSRDPAMMKTPKGGNS